MFKNMLMIKIRIQAFRHPPPTTPTCHPSPATHHPLPTTDPYHPPPITVEGGVGWCSQRAGSSTPLLLACRVPPTAPKVIGCCCTVALKGVPRGDHQ